MSRLKNEEIPLVDDKQNIDKLLIGMGIPVDLINWFDMDARMYEHAPMDEDSRVTLNDMIKIKDLAVRKEDYEGLKALGEDIKIVFEIGKEIWTIKREINFAIAKEDYPRAIELKKRLKGLEARRDGFDALYETSRYVSFKQNLTISLTTPGRNDCTCTSYIRGLHESKRTMRHALTDYEFLSDCERHGR